VKYLFFIFMMAVSLASAQAKFSLKGKILDEKGEAVPFAAVLFQGQGAQADATGSFTVTGNPGKGQLQVSAVGFPKYSTHVTLPFKGELKVILRRNEEEVEEVVVTGGMREVAKDDSPINIDLISPKLIQKTAVPNLFEATALVNGVKPQINCNVCNTGDIHINGMEGPYTLILIDGMPIVSGLSSVYGLMGIPASIIERLEVAKGPASSLYGSEAMGGTINLVTKNAFLAPRFSADVYSTSYLENNIDLGGRLRFKKADWLIGSNIYFYDNKVDVNNDNFTDVTLQKRASLFNKVNFRRPMGREFSLAARLVVEDRWGGEMNWNKSFRGGDSIYGESIYTKRAEVISKYQWPVKEKVFTQLSYNFHDQNSAYGRNLFLATQSTGFAQTYWTKQIGRHDLLAGIAFKSLWYDDNTAVTKDSSGNVPDLNNNVGVFVQHEMSLDSLSKHRLLLGLRVDHHHLYGFVPSPRIAYKWSPHYKWIFRANAGTGFRIVNVFTEDHMALTGARDVVFVEKIRPEQSYNASLNLNYKMRVTASSMLLFDASAFYYHFTNKIYANYDLDPQKVIYQNLAGHAFSRGGSLNLSLATPGNFKFMTGFTYADVQNIQRDSSGVMRHSRQLQAPLWSGNIMVSYHFRGPGVKLDLTGNWYGPQRLPVFPNDYRPEMSPWYCLLNLQVSKALKNNFEAYAGAKNLLNFIPKDPIMRPHDPFDKKAGEVTDNPNGYTFDPSYNYAPIQGIRFYVGVRISVL
jgi:outer membrane receptor for ferrienterochelin and colicins